MGRDAGGHGHDPGEPGNPFHDPKTGQFGSGGGGSDGGGQSEAPGTAGNRVAFAERAKLKAEATTKATTKATKAAAARGDHQKAQTHDGRGYPVAPHMGHPSVGTHASAGGGGSSGGSGGGKASKIKGGMKTTTGLRHAAQERVAIGEDTDARHMPLSGSAQAQRLASRRLRNIPAGR
jgi:hypothetical protein